MKTTILLLVVLLKFQSVVCQDINYAKRMVKVLSSDSFEGRGYNYASLGMKKSSEFIKYQFDSLQYNTEFQFFNHNVIVHDSVYLKVFNKELIVGHHYLPEVYRGTSRKIEGLVYVVDSSDAKKIQIGKFKFNKRLRNIAVIAVVDENKIVNWLGNDYKRELLSVGFYGIIIKKKKLTWTVWANKPMELPFMIEMLDTISLKHLTSLVYRHTANQENVKNRNIIAYSKKPIENDSTIIICAHYDHLGMIGKSAIFNGANDNASGIGMLLDLARGYYRNEWNSKYRIKFIAFGGEEAGLLGSQFYADNLKDEPIKCVINLDLMGNAEDGIMIVNALDNKKLVSKFKEINDSFQFVPKIAERPNAPNSDHYPFTQLKPKKDAIYIYVMGLYPYYHDVYDRYEQLPFTNFENVYKLLSKVIETL